MKRNRKANGTKQAGLLASIGERDVLTMSHRERTQWFLSLSQEEKTEIGRYINLHPEVAYGGCIPCLNLTPLIADLTAAWEKVGHTVPLGGWRVEIGYDQLSKLFPDIPFFRKSDFAVGAAVPADVTQAMSEGLLWITTYFMDATQNETAALDEADSMPFEGALTGDGSGPVWKMEAHMFRLYEAFPFIHLIVV